MKLSISISNYTAIVATNVLPIGNVIVRGIVVCTAASSFSASLQLTNNHVTLVPNLDDSVNLWVLIIKYKRLYYVLTG